MKNPHVCRLTAEASILVPGRAGLMLGPGAVVDFDRELAPGFTVREALGDLASSFEPLNTSPAPSTARTKEGGASRRSADTQSAAAAAEERG